jgi:hypothetical protein
MSKGPHKAVVANGVIVGCEYCGRSPPFPDGGCASNILPVQGKIYLNLIIVPHSKFCIIYLFLYL